MLQSSRSVTYPHTRIWNRARVQFGGALVFAVVLPVVVLTFLFPAWSAPSLVQSTSAGNIAAALMSVFLLRNISIYPGMRGAYFVLPAVMMAFTVVFAVFLFLRLDYSRVLLIAGGAGMLMWLYVVQLLIDRAPAMRVGVVPFGDVATLGEVDTLDLIWLRAPDGDDVQYDVIAADFRADLPDEWEAFLSDRALQSVPVFHVKQLRESLTGRVEIEHLSENHFGSLIPFRGYLRLRRVLDFVAAVVVGMVLLPVFAMVAVAIKLDSPGPILFRQVRIGYRGQPFRVAKFRTMVHRACEGDGREGAMTKDNDQRITRLGRFLRRSRIDELPQILNILKGEMSWIGPRPEAEVLSKWYEAELPFYRYRHIVPPGITGWAQVNQGHVFELNQVTSKLQYDFYYIKNFSPWLDALIVARTIQTMLTGSGSR